VRIILSRGRKPRQSRTFLRQVQKTTVDARCSPLRRWRLTRGAARSYCLTGASGAELSLLSFSYSYSYSFTVAVTAENTSSSEKSSQSGPVL
jgi:hypothetical protein